MRCPSCGARNTDEAAWCTQCFEMIVEAADGEEPTSAAGQQDSADAPDAAAVPGQPDPTAPAVPEPAAAQDRAVRVDGDLIEWRCATCDGWNPFETDTCASCGGPRSGFAPEAARTDRSRPELPLVTTLVASALLPGLGHLLIGATGSGVGRLLLWLLWGGGGVGLLLTAGGGLAAAVLLSAAAALWAVSLVDLHRAAAGDAPIATGRALAWAVVGVTLLLVMAMVAVSWRGGVS